MGVLKRLVRWVIMWLGPGGGTLDPFRDLPVLKKTPPKGRSGAVAVAEPDDE